MKKRKQFFQKIFIVYVLLILIFAVVIASIFFIKNNEIIHIQSGTQRKIFIEQVRDKIDLNINIVFNVINQLRVNENLIRYSRSPSNNYYDVIKIREKLPQHLDAFPNSQSTIDVYKQGTDLVITPKFTLSLDKFLSAKGFEALKQQEIHEFINTQQLPGSYIIITSNNDQLIGKEDKSITIIKKALIEGGNEMVFFVTFYERYFLPNLNLYTNDTFAITRGDHIITIKTILEEEAAIKELDAQISGTMDQNALNHLQYFEIEHNGHYFNVMESQALDWKYIYISSNLYLKREINSLVIKSLCIVIILAAFGIVAAFFTAKLMYKPVGNIINNFRSYNENDDVEKDEFKYLARTADSIYKANEKLQMMIQSNRISLRDKFLKDLLYGLVPAEMIYESLEHFDMNHLLNSKLTVAVLEYVNYVELEECFSKEGAISIRSQVFSIIGRQLSQETVCETLELDYKRFAVVFKETGNDKIRKILNNAMSGIEENFEITLIAAIGKTIESVEDINQSVHEALNILEYRHVLDKRAVLAMDDMDNKNDQYFYPMDFESNLINFTVRGMKIQANANLLRILDENFKHRQLSKDAVVQFIFAIIATVKRILQKVNKLEKEFFKEDSILYMELTAYENKQQLVEKIKALFDKILTQICSEDEKVNTGIADLMTAYIEANYSKDISLDDIAVHFNLSRGYICGLFKYELGKNFKEYLDIYRINKAKELLANKNVKINKLARKMGYNSTGTFIRIFNKYVGISPGQYMENKQAE